MPPNTPIDLYEQVSDPPAGHSRSLSPPASTLFLCQLSCCLRVVSLPFLRYL